MKLNKKHFLVMLLFGLLLIVIAIPTERKTIQTEEIETDLEKRLIQVLQRMEGVGAVQVMITYQEDEKIEGIVVVAEGGDNAVVIRNVTGVIQALFDVDSHKIKVIKGKQIN